MKKATLTSLTTAWAALGDRPRRGSSHGSGSRANEGRHAHLQHIAGGWHDCRGTAATGLHLCIGERQGARGVCGHRQHAWARHRRHVRRPTDLGRCCADHTAPGGVGGNLCGCDRRRHGRRRSGCQPPGRRLGPHRRLAAGVRAGADGHEHCGGRIHNGAAAGGRCARTSQGPVMTSSSVNQAAGAGMSRPR